MFEHLSENMKRVNVRDFGAIGDGVANDTQAIRAAAESLTDGGIVYIPAGIYLMDFIPFYEGVTYLLDGKVDDVSKGYTDELRERVESGKEFALLRSTGKSDMFMNHELRKFARGNAVSNYGMSGGALDCVGAVRAFIFVHCENVVLENCIVIDSPNNHAIQVTGSKNVVIRNCMFAGYNFNRGCMTAETIQIEQNGPGSIGPQMFSSSSMSYGEYTFTENVLVENCYFGKSNKFGAPLIPIGHHGQSYKPGVTGCVIRGCTFDNPRHMALRPYAWADLTIENNTFISTEPEKEVEVADALITYVVGKPNPKGIGFDDEGHYLNATYEVDYACPGCLGSKIRNNKFIVKGNRIPRILNAVGSNKQGMKVTYNMIKIDEFMGKARIFNGYKTVRNMVSDLEFTDNEINILDSKPEVRDYLLRFEKVNGITLKNNVINSNVENYARWYRGNEAVELVDCEVGNDALTRYIEGEGARGHRIHLPLGNGETCSAHCACKLLLTLYTDVRGSISAEGNEDGDGIVTVTAAEGYRFVGWRALDVESPLAAGDVELDRNLSLVAEYAE